MAKTKVAIQMGGLEGSTCEGVSRYALVAGSKANVSVVVVSTDQASEFKGFSEAKPEWLSLEFSYGTEWDEFVVSPELSRLLNPEYFLEEKQLEVNDYVKQGEEIDRSSTSPIYYFAVDLPENLAGTSICVRAVLSPPPYGPLRPAQGPHSRNLACIQVVGPCSIEDVNHALASHILIKKRMGKIREALSMADSLVGTGWRSYEGLLSAVSIASRLGHFDSALHLLDVQFETYGRIGHRDANDLPPYQIFPVDPDMALAEYSRKRELLLQAKTAQEQKK